MGGNELLSTLKNTVLGNRRSRISTTDDFKKSIKAAFPQREEYRKQQEMIKNQKFKVVISKKQRDKEEEVPTKFIREKQHEISKAGNLLFRYLNLDRSKLSYDISNSMENNTKELNKICRRVGINFGKKAPKLAYDYAASLIFRDFIEIADSADREKLEQLMIKNFEDFFEISLEEEVFQSLFNIFSTILPLFENIMNAQITNPQNEEMLSYQLQLDEEKLEQGGKFESNYSHHDSAPIKFDIYDIPNEYISIEEDEYSGGVLVTRGTGKISAAPKKQEQEAATLGKADKEVLENKNLTLYVNKGNEEIIKKAEEAKKENENKKKVL